MRHCKDHRCPTYVIFRKQKIFYEVNNKAECSSLFEYSYWVLILILIIKQSCKKISMSTAIWTSSCNQSQVTNWNLYILLRNPSQLCELSSEKISVIEVTSKFMFVNMFLLTCLLMLEIMVDDGKAFVMFSKPRNESWWVLCADGEMLPARRVPTWWAGLRYCSWRSTPSFNSPFQYRRQHGNWVTDKQKIIHNGSL